MFKFKSKKVFEKLNKMDRKQAYTIGAIAVVLVVALIMLISAATSGDDDSFDGMNARGYDLAQMPFATDEAEKYLLANAYPDMQENGSTLLYSALEKEERQAEDTQNSEEESENTEQEGEDSVGSADGGEDSYRNDSGRGYGGYSGRGYGGGSAGRGKTEIGQLTSASMASAGSSGVNATWGPSGDFHQFKGKEDRGSERPAQLKTDDARRGLAQFRSGSLAAARMNENKMRNMGKAVFGGDIRGSEAFGKDGVDLSKLQNGGFTLDTSAPTTTTDLENLDKKVADAAKDAEDKKNEEDKREWWEDMLIDLAKNTATTLVNSFMETVGDTIKGTVAANRAAHYAGEEFLAEYEGLSYQDLPASWRGEIDSAKYEDCKDNKCRKKLLKKTSGYHQKANSVKSSAASEYVGSTTTQYGATQDVPQGKVRDSAGNICEPSKLKDGKCS